VQCQRDSKPSSAHHKDHFQWPDWEPTVYNSFQRSLPLVSVPDQRNLPSYFDTNHVSVSAFNNVDTYDLFNNDWQNVSFDEVFDMGDTSLDTSPDGEALFCDPVTDNNISITFPEGFFINPFAVSFPGDLPCSDSISMGKDLAPSMINPFIQGLPGDLPYPSSISMGTGLAPSSSPPRSGTHPHHVHGGRVEKNRHASSISNASTKVSSPSHVLEQKITVSKPEVKKSSPAKSSMKYGPEIHFVDMTNKNRHNAFEIR
jgi:hypothetical protein